MVEYIWGVNVGDTWDNSLSVTDFSTESIKVYPNPATNKLFISGTKQQYDISVFSSEGRLVLTKK
ncbi:T9SS type A sorting domain-containing protein [Lacinutrix jangbogonensis]|uniref:T9SS type A sorting domain-containing protein n=1 Tax=Lacinutrix jangbogonensis TaxID=1469557 RepID=UPI000A543D42|nr:T9SS type A sorting domain-containing protein [Lacinutrix jangbogonensis]